DIIDQQAPLRKRNALRHAGWKKRFAPLSGAHRLTRGVVTFSHFVEHLQSGFNNDSVSGVACGIAPGEAETALGDAAVGFIIDAPILGPKKKIEGVAARAPRLLTKTTAVPVGRGGKIEKGILHLDALDVADARRGDVHMTAGVDAIAAGGSAHARAVDV